jgi:hypothetical protein
MDYKSKYLDNTEILYLLSQNFANFASETSKALALALASRMFVKMARYEICTLGTKLHGVKLAHAVKKQQLFDKTVKGRVYM